MMNSSNVIWKFFHNGHNFLKPGVTNQALGKTMLRVQLALIRKKCCLDGQDRPIQTSYQVVGYDVKRKIYNIEKGTFIRQSEEGRNLDFFKESNGKKYIMYDSDAKYPCHEVNQRLIKDVIDVKCSIEDLKKQLFFRRNDENSTEDPTITAALSKDLATELHQLPRRCHLHKHTSHPSQGESSLIASIYQFIESMFKFYDYKNYIASKKVGCNFDVHVERHGKPYSFQKNYVMPDKAIIFGDSYVRTMTEIKANCHEEDFHDFFKSAIVCSISALALKGNLSSVEIPFLIGNHQRLTLYSAVLDANDEYPKMFQVCSASTYDPHQMKEVAFNLMAILERQSYQFEHKEVLII